MITTLRFSVLSLVFLPFAASGHGGENHESPGIDVNSAMAENANSALPINVGGPFSLVDHHGNLVTEKTYQNCQIMCSISLKRIGDALELLEREGDVLNKMTPLVVTVDPQNDTPAKLKESLEKYHPSLVGLTGTTENLGNMYKAYKQSPSLLEEPMNGKAVVSHNSYFHLMGPDGQFQTLFPPILTATSMASILKKYVH